MSAPHNRLPRRVPLAFMLSGVSALVYEVVWVRLLGDLFGHTAYAVGSVANFFWLQLVVVKKMTPPQYLV